MPEFRPTDVDRIGPNTFLSCFLVREGARKAALLEPSDVGEARSTDPKTAAILQHIRALFPDLVLTPSDWGVWISRDSLDAERPRLSDEVVRGKLLGYPCADQFGQPENPSLPSFAFHILATYRGQPVGLMSNVCTDDTCRPQFDALVDRFRRAIASNAWVRSRFTKVRLDVQPSFPPLYLLNKVLALGPDALTPEEDAGILNVLWNELGVQAGDLLAKQWKTLVDLRNPFHQGIVLSVLLQSFVAPYAPLYPLPLLPQGEVVMKKLDQQGEEYVNLFKSTQLAREPRARPNRQSRRRQPR
jgi:hypothetical protein